WLPLDLVHCDDPRVGPALHRAFGRHMIAADDAAAAVLARCGLSSVTLTGSVSHRGVLTGGWDGGGGGSVAGVRLLLERLWELTEIVRLEERLSVRLAQQQRRAAAAERRQVVAEAEALEAVAVDEEIQAAERQIQDLDEQLVAAQH
ncbi:hypothetical protein VaNZ11_011282, partial [Volvox africanus]